MRVSQVVAHAFGPLHDQVLDLADGLTVVVGDNESGKSSWHAAIYAALCGRRRRRGKPAAWEARFTERHRPWDGDEWLVTARISLDDGRRVELRQDLDGKVDCGAIDLDTGEDVSAEIIVDGAPDATRWLGLERASFLATACVEQAQLLRVRDEADGLAQAVQRAADTAGTDATAAEALRLIDAFRREHVGSGRSGSSRPLRRALDATGQARRHVEEARSAHDEYLTARRQADELAGAAELAEADAAAAETVLAECRAEEWRRRARRVVELSRGLARMGGAQPAGSAGASGSAGQSGSAAGRAGAGGVEDELLEAEVTEALAAWQARPEPVALTGPTAGELDAQLAELPDMPEGDLEPAAEVLAAHRHLGEAMGELTGPSAPAPRLARQARWAFVTAALSGLAGTALRARAGLAGSGAVTGPVAGGGGGAVSLGGTVLVVAAVVCLAVGFLLARRARAVRQQAQRAVRAAIDALVAALRARGETPDTPLSSAPWSGRTLRDAAARADRSVERYRGACLAREHVAGRAAQRAHLQARLQDRLAAEQLAARVRTRRLEIEHRVLALARQLDLLAEAEAHTPQVAAARLSAWRATRRAEHAARARIRSGQAELDGLLAGASPAELSRQADEARLVARDARERFTQRWPERLDLVEAARAQGVGPQRLADLRARADQARAAAARAAGECDQRSRVLPAVAEAEEAYSRAADQLADVQRLDETLRLTTDFLTRAQERVHHDVAPVLATSVRRWLPGVTQGRYQDVAVDPTTLTVRVAGPTRRWRDAAALSHGTAEQVYLLLRLALVEHLTRGHDTAPLLFDEVTVYADPARTAALLDLVAAIARERQIVLFTQEQQVVRWAEAHLGRRDRLVRLPTIPVG
jgi:hypothetical protein